MKRYGLCVLNYIITSNHVHLLFRDRSHVAFREDLYHATAVDSEMYLARYRSIVEENDAYGLKEAVMPYATQLEYEMDILSAKNTILIERIVMI